MERVGVGFSGGMSPQDIVECVELAEELGYESAWVAEGHGGDQFSVLTACAVATERIKLGTSITSVYVRSAPTIAMAAASVDYFSNGRFILGLGTSHKVQVEPEHGLEFTRPVQRLRECMDIVRAILKDSDVSYHGGGPVCGHRRPQCRTRGGRRGGGQPDALRPFRKPGRREGPDAPTHRVLCRPFPPLPKAYG